MPKPSKFWIDETSPKEALKEYVLSKNPEGTLWDIFESYEPFYETPQAPPNKSEAWLAEQSRIVDEIAAKYFSQAKLSEDDIQNLLISIDEALLPEDEQEWDQDDEDYADIAKEIAATYLIPHRLNEKTVDQFSSALEKKLEKLNSAHIEKTNKSKFMNIIDTIDYYSKSKKDVIKKNLSMMWDRGSQDDEFYDDEEDDYDEDEHIPGSYNVREFGLACSDMFFGFGDDAGDTDYQEREQKTQDKIEKYAAEITELLGFAPNPELQPKSDNFDMDDDSAWDIYYTYTSSKLCQNIYSFDFIIWADDTRVLILTSHQEDKELPIEINLKAMPRDKYEEMIGGYHTMLASLPNKS